MGEGNFFPLPVGEGKGEGRNCEMELRRMVSEINFVTESLPFIWRI